MSLIKCTECGQEVSTEATTCPHCGNPIMATPMPDEEKVDRRGTWVTLIGFGVIGLYFVLSYVGQLNVPQIGSKIKQKLDNFIYSSNNTTVVTQNSSTGADNSQNIPLQEVKNLGYDFYVGEIESSGVTNINDDLKNQITKIAYTAHVPINILKSVPIIILNNLALTGNQYISTGGINLKVPDLKPDFLSEGGVYVTFTSGGAVIFINKPIIAQGQLNEVLTHELGHVIGSKLADQDWVKYYQLRSIPSITGRDGTIWNMSPEEDFAEVYKNIATGIAVRTFFGLLIPSSWQAMGEEGGTSACGKAYSTVYNNYLQQFKETNTCPPFDPSNMYNGWDKCIGQVPKSPTSAQISQAENIANNDSSVQLCRRDVLSNPSKYPSDWMYSIPYKTTVDQATKNFIADITNRLNQQ